MRGYFVTPEQMEEIITKAQNKMKTQVSNEFILEAHKEACITWKARIEKECPELFKNTLEVGKWYKEKEKSNLLVCFTDIEKGYGYGVNRINEWNDNFCRDDKKSFELATEQEVKEALINEAKKMGFIKGAKFLSVLTAVKSECGINYNYYYDENELYSNGMCLFKDGKWAEIVKEPTEIELIKAEIEKLNERLNKLL
jgi:hypothetical protein